MQSIRRRLTVSYALALTATIGVFGAALYWDRSQAAGRDAEERLEARLEFEGKFALSGLQQQARFYSRLVRVLPAVGTAADTTYDLLPEIQGFFRGMGDDYLFVVDRVGRFIYVSTSANNLEPTALRKVRDLMVRVPVDTAQGRIRLTPEGDLFRYYLTPVTAAGNDVSALLVAAQPGNELFYGPKELLLAMLLVAPLILYASIALGYWLAGRALTPMDVMIGELEAVRDGRSLHRRLAVPAGQDELARLAQNMNAMLDRVEQSFVALRRFTADASHELKTPLMVLRAGVERSLTDPNTPTEVVAALDETLRQINQMSELVTNLLTLARADEGRASLVRKMGDLRALVEDVGETAEILGDVGGVTVSLELPPEPVVVPMDATRIRQLLLNLVTNAVKYTAPGGTVTLRLAEVADSAEIVVQDTGIGIAPGDLEHVFERFWRADPVRSRTGDRPGTGLGLAIVKWIAEAHGGTVGVQSRPGRGSSFRVTLPRLDQEPPSAVREDDQ